MKKLGKRNYALISNAVRIFGTYNPKILGYFKEKLLSSQVEEIEKFLTWIHANPYLRSLNKYIYEDIFADFKDSQIGD